MCALPQRPCSKATYVFLPELVESCNVGKSRFPIEADFTWPFNWRGVGVDPCSPSEAPNAMPVPCEVLLQSNTTSIMPLPVDNAKEILLTDYYKILKLACFNLSD